MQRHLRITLALFTLALVGLGAAPAALAARYASPTGTAAKDCLSPANACDLPKAITGASKDDEVIVEPGHYTLTSELSTTPSSLNVHGALGQPRPVIDIGANRLGFISGAHYSYLSVESSSSGEFFATNGTLGDRMFIKLSRSSLGQPACQCYGDINDSVIVNSGTSPAAGLGSNGGTGSLNYRNDTIISTNPASAAIELHQQGGMPFMPLVLHAVNVIARNVAGGPAVVADGEKVSITMSHSNYGTVVQSKKGVFTDGGGNQTAAPIFANAAALNFAEAAGSPTIDAGLLEPLSGPLDFAGSPRAVGGLTDIGAYEFIPPVVGPLPLPLKPSNRIRFGKLKLDRVHGLAKLQVKVPGAGKLVLRGKGVKKVTKTAGAARTVTLKVKPTGRKRVALLANGKVTVPLTVVFTPVGGTTAARPKTITLKQTTAS